MTIEEIKSLMKSGDVAGAEAAAQELLAAEPDSAEAKMLYGTCRQLLGDNKTFGEIHDALAPKMATERDGKTLSLWRRYHKLWMALIAGGLVLAGVAGGACYFGKDIMNMFGVAGRALSAYQGPVRVGLEKPAITLYRGPSRTELHKVDTDWTNKWTDKSEADLN